MNEKEAAQWMRANEGHVLHDAHGIQWRFRDGSFEARWPECGMPDWQPFGRSPMVDDAPFQEEGYVLEI